MLESSPLFADGFGRRVVRVGSGDAAPTEHLLLDAVLAGHAGFAAALRERAAHLHGRRLTSYARVHRVEADGDTGVSIVSEHVRGWRLADLLDVAETENLTLDIGVVMLLLRQLLPTAALLSTQSRDTASGALGPEHLLLTPHGRLVLTDYVLGSAIDSLNWSPERLWTTLRVATAVGPGARTVAQRGDVLQVGLTVISLMVGRRLRDDEFPDRLEDLVTIARQKTPAVIDAPLSVALRDWLMRALQLVPKSFGTLFDAQMALERLLATEPALLAQPAELDLAVRRFERFMPEFVLPVPEPELFLLEAPPPGTVPLAVAFDTPAPVVARAATSGETGAASAPFTPAVASPSPAHASPAPAAPTAAALAPPPAEATLSGRVDAEPPIERLDAGANPPRATQAALQGAPSVHVPTPRAGARPVHAELDTAAAGPARELAALAPWWQSARAVAALVAVAVVQTLLIGWLASRPTEGLGGDGELVVQSRPDGARVVVDDKEYGVTPLTIRLSPGTHVLQLRAGAAEPRVIPLSIRPGVQTAQYVELLGVASTGVLEVRSEPSKARVTIDGHDRGTTPLTLRDVSPGDYRVVLERAGRTSPPQVVRVEPGRTAQLLVPFR